LHRWRLRFEQSGPHRIARALRDGIVSVFGSLPLRRHVESEEVGLSPFLRPLAQTARAVFPQAAFLCDRLR
jgi:hypothetical protein